MSTYKSYGTRKTVPKRLARKHLRSEVFWENKKAAKVRRKAERLARRNDAPKEQGE